MSSSVFAQSYSGVGGNIPDYSTAVAFPMMVSGLDSSRINGDFGVEYIWIQVNHSAVRDLAIYVMSPDGTNVELCSGNGGLGDNFDSTIFDGISSLLITTGAAPFRNSYIPEHSLGLFNNGQIGSGIWRLYVADYVSGDTGDVLSWGIKFSDHPVVPISFSTGPCQDYDGRACECPDGAMAPCLLLPDMIISESMLRDTFWRRESNGLLQVTNSCANIGYGPIQLEGTGRWKCGDSLVGGPMLCSDGTWSKQELKQRVWKKTTGPLFEFKDTLVGAMQFHADLGHRHLHIDDWAQNTIRIKGPELDAREWPIVAKGNKVSFCVYDHLTCGDAFMNCVHKDSIYYYANLSNRGLGTGYDACGALIQGISVGYSDVYDWTLEGQEIPLDSLCNGKYFLVAEIDPKSLFQDVNRANNVSIAEIELTKQRSLCCRAKFRIDTLDAMENIYRFVSLAVPSPDSVRWNIGSMMSSEAFPTIDFDEDSVVNIPIVLSVFTPSCIDSIQAMMGVFPDHCKPTWKSEWKFNQLEYYLQDSLKFRSIIIRDVSPFANHVLYSNFHHLYTSSSPDLIDVRLFFETTDTNDCKYTDTLKFYNRIESLQALKSLVGLAVYPNPIIDNECIVDLSGFQSLNDVNVRVVDLQGREVYNMRINNNSLTEKILHIYLKDEMRGLYLLEVESDHEVRFGKISTL